MDITGSRNNSPLNVMSVDTQGRAYTRTTASTENEKALSDGEGFSIYTADMTIVNANRNAVFYFKNLEDRDVVFTSVTVGSGTSTGGADNIILVEQVGGIVASDPLVTGGTSINAVNNNLGSAKELSATINKGPVADYAAGSAGAGVGVRGDFTTSNQFEILSQVPRGGEFGLVITPPAGNTNMVVTVSASCHLIEDI